MQSEKTTTDEEFDVVDEDGKVVGSTTRDKAHKDPSLIHPVVHCWLFNSQGQVLLQKRSQNKKLGAGLWDISVGGHMNKGEKPLEGLLRELEEELGLDGIDAVVAEKYIAQDESQTEYVYVFSGFLPDDAELAFNPDEIEMVAWFDLADLFTESANNNLKITNWIFEELPRVLQFHLTNS